MRICIGSDHAGFELKSHIFEYLADKGYDIIDVGTFDTASTDYPVWADKVCDAVLDKSADFGILICGTGIGMSIAANKRQGILCALVNDIYSARLSKQHNNANVIAIGARVVGIGMAEAIVDAYMSAEFETRHQKRLDMLADGQA
ncbi:ribose-5-phosphate isomerase [Clostridia bacterium]|nr:ribose-5-phosphate isomerase [Clostridia bacterium]